MSTTARLPINRGYDTHLGILGGMADHFNFCFGRPWNNPSVVSGVCNMTECVFTDLWKDHGPAYGLNNTYSTYLFGHQAEELLLAHDPAVPFFLYFAYQVVHSPIEAPLKLLNQFANNTRQGENAMCLAFDESVGNITKILKNKGMWSNTVLLFSADNGGPLQANNYPLRGGKMGDFEGGVRSAAFVAGGMVPAAIAGTRQSGYVHLADWYCEVLPQL